jgi:pyruvate ferredoxin oxidoreductase gamma subunit
LGLEKGRVATVDAQGISIAELGRPMPNIPIIGALLKVTGMFDYNIMEKDIRHKFEEKFGGKVVEGNLRALKRAYDEVKQE